MIEQSTRASSLEATLHMWREAAEAILTDPVTQRQRAYQDIIAVVRQQLASALTVGDIVVMFGRSELHGIAIRAALSRYGKVLNAEVIVGAACWQQFCSLTAQRRDGDDRDFTKN